MLRLRKLLLQQVVSFAFSRPTHSGPNWTKRARQGPATEQKCRSLGKSGTGVNRVCISYTYSSGMGNKSHSDRVAADHTGEETTRSLENWPKKKKIPFVRVFLFWRDKSIPCASISALPFTRLRCPVFFEDEQMTRVPLGNRKCCLFVFGVLWFAAAVYLLFATGAERSGSLPSASGHAMFFVDVTPWWAPGLCFSICEC